MKNFNALGEMKLFLAEMEYHKILAHHHNLHFTMILHIFLKNLNFNELKKSRFKTRIFHIHEFRSNTVQ